MKPNKFLFVNKNPDSKSLSHSNKDERIQIHSHVQKERHYKKLTEGIVLTTQLPHLGVGSGSTEGPHQVPLDENNTSAESSLHASSSRHAAFQPYETSPSATFPFQHSLDPQLWALNRDLSQSPKTVPLFPTSAQGVFDPFDATCIRVDASVHDLLQYFLRVHHPNIWHLERAAREDKAYTFRYDAMSVLQGCLHDEYNMFTLLASMASYMKYIDGVYFSEDGDYYIHRALRASRDHFKSQQPITARMIFNTFHLGCAEWYRYNSDAAYVHLQAAKRMTDSIGGLRMLDQPLAELLLTGDAYVSAERQVKPQFSYSDFENGDDDPMTIYGIQQLQLLVSGNIPIGSGLLISAHQDLVPVDLRWVVLDLAVVLSLLKSQSTNSPGRKPPVELLHWLHIRTLTIRHRLLVMDLADPRSHAIRTSLILWIFMCFTVAGRKRSMKFVAPILQTHLLAIPMSEWHDHEDIRLWLCIIGALASSDGSETRDYFVSNLSHSHLAAIVEEEAIFTALISLSEQYFYLESAQEVITVRLATEIYEMKTASEKGKGKDKGKGVEAEYSGIRAKDKSKNKAKGKDKARPGG